LKPLLFLPSPRDIPEVKESVDKLKIDKLWIKYHHQEEAYVIARDWFLRHYEYTHLVIHPDDLLAQNWQLEHLLLSAATDAVMSGWCVNTILPNWEELNQSSISKTLPYPEPIKATYGTYNFMKVKNIERLLGKGTAIIKVKFSGFALCCIPRIVVEKVPFRGDGDCCMDATFALDLDAEGIEQFANLRVRTQHLRRSPSELQVGKKEKAIIFEENKD